MDQILLEIRDIKRDTEQMNRHIRWIEPILVKIENLLKIFERFFNMEKFKIKQEESTSIYDIV